MRKGRSSNACPRQVLGCAVWSRPLSVTIIGGVFIAVGCIAVFTTLLPLVLPADGSAAVGVVRQRLDEIGHLLIVRVLAILGGAFLLYGHNWARWLLAVWLGYHVALGALHSTFALVVHVLLFL